MPPKSTTPKTKANPFETGGKGKSRATKTKTAAAGDKDDADTPTKGLSDQKLPLPAWLKTFTDRGVDMRLAMTLAGKLYTTMGSPAQLGKLNGPKLMEVGITDKDQKRAITGAIRGLKLSVKDESSPSASSSTAAGTAMSKKRKWQQEQQDDLVNPLIPGDPALRKGRKAVEYDVSDFDFKEIHDIEEIRAQTVVTNRAPCMTAWAYIIAEKMGFDRLEALSLASTFTSVTSTKHALALGNIYTPEQTRDAQLEMDELPQPAGKRSRYASDDASRLREGEQGGHSQPWVSIMKRSPVIQRADGTWRGVLKGMPVEPYRAHSYISKNFSHATPYVIGALRILAQSYTVDELQEQGYGMYVSFRPDVSGWGDRAVLYCSNIIDMIPEEKRVDDVDEERKPDVISVDDTDDAPAVTTASTEQKPLVNSGQEGVKVEDEVQAEREDAAEVEEMKRAVPASPTEEEAGSVKVEVKEEERDDGVIDLDREDVFEGLHEAEYDHE
ncbi:hypothetical protein QFC21_006767 [Naganishia friedmannii]|uniref:Uncharacterized protein n=1 Tax=Naganishia friedmannii TaxID=89922 RepID=A0ACC2V111_9TREE|nr:hypothetical protein QFC21_006767 [Naganishia friedmannii]